MVKGKRISKCIAWLITMAMLVSLVPTFTVFADSYEAGDFAIEATDGTTVLTDGSDYSFAAGTLTIKTLTPVTVKMKSGVSEPSNNNISIESTGGETNVTLDGVNIATNKSNAVDVKGTGDVTLNFSGINSLSAANAGIYTAIKTYDTLKITSSTSGELNISNVKNAIYSDYNTLEIDGNIKITAQNCTSMGIYSPVIKYINSVPMGKPLTISGTPTIDISAVKYAVYSCGIFISGGTLNLSNTDGFAVCSGNNEEIKLSGNTDITMKSVKGGIQTTNGLLTVTDNAKIKMYDMVDGKKTAVTTNRNAITCGKLIADQNALIDLAVQYTAISAGKESSKISGDAVINIMIDVDKSVNAFSFKNQLDVCDNAKIDINAVKGDVVGINCFNGTLNISDFGNVTVKGASTSIYSKLNMSGNSSLTALDDKKSAVEKDAVIEAPAKIKLSSLNRRVLAGKFTVKPETGKAYLVKTGASEEAAVTEYYAAETQENSKPSWRYFYAEPANVLPVTITGTDKEYTYDGNTYDVSQMFNIDANAGEAAYSIVTESGSDIGGGTISGKELTVTKAGKIKVKVNTAANGVYLPGEATAILTVRKGTPGAITFPTASEITYGDTLGSAALTGGVGNGTFAWENTSIVPKVSEREFSVVFTPNDADVFDYSGVTLSRNVSLTVNPRPVDISWDVPNLVYDGTDKTVTPSVSNKVSGDEIQLTVTGTTTARDAGDYSAEVTGTDNENYTLTGGTNLKKEYTIEAKTLNADNITAIADQTFTGDEIKPILEVKDGDKVLTLDTDYTVVYDANTNEGTAKATVTFIGNYKGTAEKPFTILPKTIGLNIALTAPVRYAVPQTNIDTEEYSASIVWSPSVTAGFAPDTVYTADVTITPKANYTLVGVPENGYEFTGSSSVTNTADSGTATVVYPATARKSGGSLGGMPYYTVIFDTNGGTSISSQSIAEGSTVKEPKTPTKEGFEFAGWYTDKEFTKKYDFSSSVTKKFTLYADWKEKSTDNSENQIILTIGKTDALVFGETRTNDVAPKVVNDRTMLPARFVAESLGAKVEWDGSKKLVTITGKNVKTNEDVTILLTIGAASAVVNGKDIMLDSPAFVENDRTYTPVRFISEHLGADVEWIESELKVVITK